MNCKIFRSAHLTALEEVINDWLESHQPMHIHSVSQSELQDHEIPRDTYITITVFWDKGILYDVESLRSS